MTSEEPMDSGATPVDHPVEELSPRAFWAIYALVVAIFIVVDNPLFKNPFDIDRSIAFSYVPIPFLVVLMLAIERKLGLVSFVLGTVKLTTLKFGTTYFLAIVCWVARGAPPPVAHAAPVRAHTEAPARDDMPPTPTPIDPARTGSLRGRVVTAANVGVAGALVYVSSGLEDLAFAPPTRALALTNDGHGFEPSLAVVQTFQPVSLRAADGRLHTAVAVDASGHTVFNRPLLAEGAEQRITFREAAGWVRIRCTIHNDDTAALLVLGHPFWTRTSLDGSFTLDHVPHGALEITAVATDERRASTRVALAAPDTADLVLTL